jgi:hypothetical protein
VETEKQPLLGNVRTNNRVFTLRDAYSRCHVALAAYACKVTSCNIRRRFAGGFLCGSASRLHNEDLTQLELELRESLELVVGRIIARKELSCAKKTSYVRLV